MSTLTRYIGPFLLLLLACILALNHQVLAETNAPPGAKVIEPARAGEAAQATDPKKEDKVYQASLIALTKLFVVAVLLESAFDVVLRWSIFLAFLNRRAWRPLIMFIGAYFVVYQFNLDVVGELIDIYNANKGDVNSSQFISKLLTALILAGGSAGVYNLFITLGFRNPREIDPTPHLTPTQAWLAIEIPELPAKTRVDIKIRKVALAETDATILPIAGVIGGSKPQLRELLFSNSKRFPPNGGYTLDANFIYEIEVTANETTLIKPTKYAFAARAIVNWELVWPEDAK